MNDQKPYEKQTLLSVTMITTSVVDIIISLSCFFLRSNTYCIEMVNLHWLLFVYSNFVGIKGIRMIIDEKRTTAKTKNLSPSLMFSRFGFMTIQIMLLIFSDLIFLCFYFTFSSYQSNLFQLLTWIVYLTLIVRIFVLTIQWKRITSLAYYQPK
ncbi:hypothetical protein DERP_001443 [Dermatophagoides pteronyssinus]|uniref:Uncharacterized protein n=1 Tax=Dermatophagoides pteronyssinus TaxID=6956 RepID=A0ABQ8JEY6_DERPT|nr:hypothetical protein DERP_001443 [Dermatophagoides pteronyssinus]